MRTVAQWTNTQSILNRQSTLVQSTTDFEDCTEVSTLSRTGMRYVSK